MLYLSHLLTTRSLLLADSAALVEDELPQIFEGVIVYVNGYTDPPIHGNAPWSSFISLLCFNRRILQITYD